MAEQSKLLSDLTDSKIECLEVLSFEPELYLARVRIAGTRYRVYRAPGELLREFSQLALKKHFKGLEIGQTQLIHQSSYDEMIGNPAPAHGELKVRLSHPDQDPS